MGLDQNNPRLCSQETLCAPREGLAHLDKALGMVGLDVLGATSTLTESCRLGMHLKAGLLPLEEGLGSNPLFRIEHVASIRSLGPLWLLLTVSMFHFTRLDARSSANALVFRRDHITGITITS